MSFEQISFKCDFCKETSAGVLDFVYETVIEKRRRYLIVIEHEYSAGDAYCEKCGKLNNVWPKHSQTKTWEER